MVERVHRALLRDRNSQIRFPSSLGNRKKPIDIVSDSCYNVITIKKERTLEMLILTIIFYLLDIKHYGRDFVQNNCCFAERIGRWFLMYGWIEVVLLCYFFYKI